MKITQKPEIPKNEKTKNFYAFSSNIRKRITLHEAFYIIKTIHTIASHKIFAETRAEMY